MVKLYEQDIPEDWVDLYAYALRTPIGVPLLTLGPGYLYSYSYIVGKRQSRGHQFMEDPPRGWPSLLQTDFRDLARWVAMLWHQQDYEYAGSSIYHWGPRTKSWWKSNAPIAGLSMYAGLTTWFHAIYPYTHQPIFSSESAPVTFNVIKSDLPDSVFQPDIGDLYCFEQWLSETREIEHWLLISSTKCKNIRLSGTRTYVVILPSEAAQLDVYHCPPYNPDTVTWNTQPTRGDLISSNAMPAGNGHTVLTMFCEAQSVIVCANLTYGQDPGDTTSILVDDIYLEPQG